jgi:hypothetical protein
VTRARESLETRIRDREGLNAEFERELERLEVRFDPETLDLTKAVLKPRKTDVQIKRLSLVWLPYSQGNAEQSENLWR